MRAYSSDRERFNTNYYGMNYPDNNRTNPNYIPQSSNYGYNSYRRGSTGVTNPRGSWIASLPNNNSNIRGGSEPYNDNYNDGRFRGRGGGGSTDFRRPYSSRYNSNPYQREDQYRNFDYNQNNGFRDSRGGRESYPRYSSYNPRGYGYRSDNYSSSSYRPRPMSNYGYGYNRQDHRYTHRNGDGNFDRTYRSMPLGLNGGRGMDNGGFDGGDRAMGQFRITNSFMTNSHNDYFNDNGNQRISQMPPNIQMHYDDTNLPDKLVYHKNITGHKKCITSIIFDEMASKMYSGSECGILNEWNGKTGQIERDMKFDGSIKAMLLIASVLFVCVYKTDENMINENMNLIGHGFIYVINLKNANGQVIEAHRGAILCITAFQDFIMTGGEDATIKCFKYEESKELLRDQSEITEMSGGHSCGINQLINIGTNFLISSDISGIIKIWGLPSGELLQTINSGHNQAIINLVEYQGHIITASTDGKIKIWIFDVNAKNANPFANTVKHEFDVGQNLGERVSLTAMAGVDNTNGQNFIACALSSARVIFYKLPDLTIFGQINQVQNCKVIKSTVDHYLLIGNEYGTIKLFGWN